MKRARADREDIATNDIKIMKLQLKQNFLGFMITTTLQPYNPTRLQ